MSRSSRIHLIPGKREKHRIFLKIVMLVAFLEPISTIGQIYSIYKSGDVKGDSAFTWAFYIFCALVWLYYALKIRNKPLIVGSFLWVITEAIVLIQILYYTGI